MPLALSFQLPSYGPISTHIRRIHRPYNKSHRTADPLTLSLLPLPRLGGYFVCISWAAVAGAQIVLLVHVACGVPVGLLTRHSEASGCTPGMDYSGGNLRVGVMTFRRRRNANQAQGLRVGMFERPRSRVLSFGWIPRIDVDRCRSRGIQGRGRSLRGGSLRPFENLTGISKSAIGCSGGGCRWTRDSSICVISWSGR